MYKRNINIIIQLQHWNKSHREKKQYRKIAIFIQIIAQFTEHWARSIQHLFFFILHFLFFFFCSSLIRCATPIHFYKYVWVSAGCPWDTERVAALANFLSMLGATQSVTPSEICLLHFNFIFHFLQQGRALHRSRSIYTLFYSTHTNNHLITNLIEQKI